MVLQANYAIIANWMIIIII